MKVIALTSTRRGLASRCLRALAESRKIEIAGVLFARGASAQKGRRLSRRIRKTLRIGLLGALNGLRIRSWYTDPEAEDIFETCASLRIPISEIDTVNSDEVRRLLRESSADLGLSMGNSYIAESVFTIPRFGMINIHTEILPRFQGAQSIIWPIFERSDETGFTIHQVRKRIDGGEILFQKKFRIRFCPSLRQTVEENLKTVRAEIPESLVHVCENYEQLRAAAKSQEHGKSYTTPTIRQFARMMANHRAMHRESRTRTLV